MPRAIHTCYCWYRGHTPARPGTAVWAHEQIAALKWWYGLAWRRALAP